MKSTIRLFKAVHIKSKRTKKASETLLKKTIGKGFVFSPQVVYNYSEKELIKIIQLIEEEVGLTSEKMNSSFHKSWKKIKEADLEQLVVEQLAHYLTTYGKENPEEYIEEKEEQWGVDNLGGKIIGLGDFKSDEVGGDYVYIPKEALNIPEIDIDNIKLFIIKGYTKKELKEKLLSLLQSGIALGKDTINDVVDVATYVEIGEREIEIIRNKEVKTALYDYLGLFPENPIEFLRYIIYKATGKTLLIKNMATTEEIKAKKNLDILTLFLKYKRKYGLERLAEIFYRFKPIFLAFKTNTKLNSIINKIRKLAKKYHKPMKEDYLNEITAKIKKGIAIDENKLNSELDRVNTFRKVRLAYALKYRTKDDVESILYRIRNGKGYATDFQFNKKTTAKKVLDIVMDSIIEDIKPNVKGKKIYLPEYVHYALPATEKQFTGDFPSGSYVSIPKDMIAGIYWKNVGGHRIDLDLSIINAGEKIGWDANYRTDDRNILFSGDMTDARKSKGASELFYVRKQALNSHILLVNYYNYEEDIEVPFKIFVAKERVINLKQNYMVNPNNVICVAKTKINQKQKILGLLVTATNGCRFYFTETYLGRSITSSGSEFVDHSRKYLFDFYRNTINLNDILVKAGGKLITNKDKCDIDLSPEVLEKDKIIKLLS